MNPIHYRNIPLTQTYKQEEEPAQEMPIPSTCSENVHKKEEKFTTSEPIAIPERKTESKTANEWNICFFGD